MVVCGVGVRRGVAWCVRSQVVGMATWRGAREETGARTRRVRAFSAHALPAQAMRLTANMKRKPCCFFAKANRFVYDVVQIFRISFQVPEKQQLSRWSLALLACEGS